MTAPKASGIPSESTPKASSARPGARRHHDAVDHRDHPGGRERQLPCAGREPLPVERRRGACPPDDDDVRLQLRRESQVEVAQERYPMSVRDVLDRGLNQTQECHHPDEGQHRQEDEREGIERRAEPGHLSDEGERDQVAGQGGEIDGGATVRLRDRHRAGGLQVEVLGGRERGRGSEAWAETFRQCGLGRVATVVRGLIRPPRTATAAGRELDRCIGTSGLGHEGNRRVKGSGAEPPQPPVGPKRSVRIRDGSWPRATSRLAAVSTNPVGPQT